MQPTPNAGHWPSLTSFSRAACATLLLVFVACAPPEPQTDLASVRALLARGVAHAEIDQWAKALELFQQAAELAPEEPVAAYDLGLALFRTGDRQAAREWLDRAQANAPADLGARIELLRGKLAYEDGNDPQELEAHRRASSLDPEEAAYAHALAQLYLRLGAEEKYGVQVEQAHRLWPNNAYLATEAALWRLDQSDLRVRRQGMALLETLAARSPRDEINAYLEKGRLQLEAKPTPAKVPTPLRIVANLLRPTKSFRSDAAELQARLEPTPLSDPTQPATVTEVSPALSPEVSFATAALVPALPLAAGEKILAAVLVDDSTAHRPSAARDAGIAIVGDRGLYMLARGAAAFQTLAEIPGEVHQLLAGDVNDDERMELLLLTASGPRLWGRDDAGEWAEVPLDEQLSSTVLQRGLLVDFEHDGDLDLLATDPAGALVLVTHRGEAGFGPPTPAPLPVTTPIRRLTSTDLDGDADQDLVLASATELLILRNWRQGEFALQSRLPLAENGLPQQLLALDYNADSHLDIIALLTEGVTCWRGDGQAGLHADPQAMGATTDLADQGQPAHLTVADLDLDGDLDLLLAGLSTTSRDSALMALINDGQGRFTARSDLVAEHETGSSGAIVLDLDGDHDPDLLSWSDSGSLQALRGSGAEGQRWLRLRLRAPGRKVPRDGRGVRIQVVAGDRIQWLEPQRPNLTLGLGQARPALIKATWPNGISEYLFEPEPETEHILELSLRVEGSCPFLYASDGQELRFITDILGLAPVGMLATADTYVPADPEEYLRLPRWVAPQNGVLELVITEELREVLILDQAELVAVDAKPQVEVYNGEKWLMDSVRGLELRLMSPFAAPASVRDDRGREVLEIVRQRDERYLTNHRGPNRYQGAVTPHQLTIELPTATAAAEHPALVLVGWLHWANTSTNVARSQDPQGAPIFPYLEVPDGAGGWRRTTVPVGLPAGKTKPVVVDLSGMLDPADPRLRITTDFEVYWDLIASASLLSPEATPHHLHRLAPSSAELRWSGFSRWFRTAANGPYLFDYQDRRPYPWRTDAAGQEVVLSWQEHEGYYTAFGPVDRLLARADDSSVVLGSGEELRLSFDVASLPPLPTGWQRTYFLHSEGWEKDGDPNVSCSQTVEPLPYRGMTRDPCSGRSVASDVAGAPRTRWVGRDRLQRRVGAWGDRATLPGQTNAGR